MKFCEQYLSSDSFVNKRFPEIPPKTDGSPNGEQIQRKLFNLVGKQEKLENVIFSATEAQYSRLKMKNKKTHYGQENTQEVNLGEKDFLMLSILGEKTQKHFDPMVNSGNDSIINFKIGDGIKKEFMENSIQYDKYDYKEKPYTILNRRVSESNSYKDSDQPHTFKKLKFENYGFGI